MKKATVKKSIVSVLVLAMLASIVATLTIPVFADTTVTDVPFSGYSGNANIEEATKTVKNADGTYTNPVSNNQPQITFLIPGFGSQASTWSNNYRSEVSTNFEEHLAYNSSSFVEKIRDYTSADIYYAEITTVYDEDKKENGIYSEEGAKIGDLEFMLYKFPDNCVVEDCTTCMFEKEYDCFNTEKLNSVTQLNDISNHIVILFDPADSTGSNNQIYEQFNYVADKIVYDVKTINGGELPKVNLIGHSRGGLTAMQYALDHPYIVDGMFTIGTPFSGSFLGQSEDILSILGMSADRSNQKFTFGVEDIMNSSVYEGYMNSWNKEYDEKYAHINFHAIGGAVTFMGLSYILENDNYYDMIDKMQIAETVVDVASLLTLPVDLLLNDPGFYIYDDIFIHLESQLAYGYTGVENYVRVFEEDNIDLSMLAQANVAIPHNLEPGDAIIHDYILRNIETGNVDSFRLNPDNTYTLTGKGLAPDDSGLLVIPSTYNGLPVSKIESFAFKDNDDVGAVVIPDSVKEIGSEAFYDCGVLTEVTFSDTSTLEIIGEKAFCSCMNLMSITVPQTVRTIESGAFVGTEIRSVALGDALVEIYPSAFATLKFTQYEISENNSNYCAVDGILYSKDGTRLISYPCKKGETSFSLPATVTSIGEYAFYNATLLTSVNLGAVEYVAESAFLNCTSLATISAPDLLLAEASSFENTAFMNAEGDLKSLGKVLIKYSGTASTLVIDDYYSIVPFAFDESTNLQTLTIGGELAVIGTGAFLSCKDLETVYIDSGSFVYANTLPFSTSTENRNIYVAIDLIDEYKTNSFWSPYSDDISTHETVVKFDSNGGSSVSDGVIPYYSQVGILPIPEKSGYQFAGWFMNVDGESVEVHPYDVWNRFDTEVTFTANWNIQSYSVILHSNGGDLEDDSYYYTVNESMDLPAPTKTGYMFAGWYDNAELGGESASVIPQGSTGNKFYYAKWTANTYTVTLDYGYDGAPSGITQTVTFGESFALPVATRECFSFNGWYYDGQKYTSSSGVSVSNWDIASDVTLNASWTLEIYYVKLAIDVEGNETYYWMTTTGISQTKTPMQYGQAFPSVEAINAAFNPTGVSIKEGHKFAYFTKEPISSRTIPQQYMFDDIAMSASLDSTEIIIPLYAYFVPETDFTIIFKDYTTSASGTELGRFVADYGESISYPQPSKTGYSFNAWMVSDENGNAFNNTEFASGTIFTDTLMPDLSPNVEEDGVVIYLEAAFSPNTITIQYNSNGGSSVSSTAITYDLTSYTFPIPTKTGYTFAGWYTNQEIQYSSSVGELIRKWDIATQSVELVAKWVPIVYTITYIMNGGTHTNPTKYTIESEFNLTDASKNGCKFMGWYTTSAYTTQVTKIGPNQTGNVTLYPNFLETYTVTFEKANGQIVNETVIKGNSVEAPTTDAWKIFYARENYAITVEGGMLYKPGQNLSFVEREKTFAECFNSSNSTYEIYTQTQFEGIWGVTISSKVNVALKRDINWNSSWPPINTWYGTFDGENHYINDVVLNVNGGNSGGYGIFKENRGTIKNIAINRMSITVSDSDNTAALYVGGLVGNNYGTIDYVSIYSATITTGKSASSIGGVVGYNAGICSHCSVQRITIDGYGDMGAIAGTCSGSGALLKGCYVHGDSVTLSIKGANRSAGGIVGYLNNRATVEQCAVYGVLFKFGSYSGIDKKNLAPRMGYIVGHADNAVINKVLVSGVSINYGDLPETFFDWSSFSSYNPRKYVCAYGNGTCGLSENGTTITNTNWNGVLT